MKTLGINRSRKLTHLHPVQTHSNPADKCKINNRTSDVKEINAKIFDFTHILIYVSNCGIILFG